MTRDARRHPRAKAKIKVEYRYGSTTGVGYTRDISEGGIFLSARHVVRQGTRVFLRLYLPGSYASSEPLKLIGIVTRIVRDLPAPGALGPSTALHPPPGMGIQIDVAYARTRETLEEFITGLLNYPEDHAQNISALEGSTSQRSEYVVRFAGQAQDEPSTVDAVDEAFAFEAGIDWARIGRMVRMVLWLGFLLAALLAAWCVAGRMGMTIYVRP